MKTGRRTLPSCAARSAGTSPTGAVAPGPRTVAPGLARGLLLDALPEGWLEQALALGCVAVVCRYPLWDAATVARVHQAGMRCLSYTVNDAAAARQLIAWGIDGIITDRVDRFAPD